MGPEERRKRLASMQKELNSVEDRLSSVWHEVGDLLDAERAAIVAHESEDLFFAALRLATAARQWHERLWPQDGPYDATAGAGNHLLMELDTALRAFAAVDEEKEIA
jgi:hypothetical protein